MIVCSLIMYIIVICWFGCNCRKGLTSPGIPTLCIVIVHWTYQLGVNIRKKDLVFLNLETKHLKSKIKYFFVWRIVAVSIFRIRRTIKPYISFNAPGKKGNLNRPKNGKNICYTFLSFALYYCYDFNVSVLYLQICTKPRRFDGWLYGDNWGG